MSSSPSIDIPLSSVTHPIFDCGESAEWEKDLLRSDDDAWLAMAKVGEALGRAITHDYRMSRLQHWGLRIIALIGKGHNGGDALLGIAEMAREPGFIAQVTLALSGPVGELKPNTKRAFDQLQQSVAVRAVALSDLEEVLAADRFDICIDGLLGMQFKPPLREGVGKAIRLVNESRRVGFRVAVDLPSGVGDASDAAPFRADVTYATGIVKLPLLGCPETGNIRYLDIGFFEKETEASHRVISDRVLDPLRALRPAGSDKRQHGHLAVVAGSRSMPGAVTMAVEAAVRSGVGLVTVCAPESMVAHLASRIPEAMWRPWPETPEGGLALEGLWQIRALAGKATALLMGPGMGHERETLALILEIVSEWRHPLLLDADALRPEVVGRLVDLGNDRCLLTPHDGEFKRISGGWEPSDDNCVRFASEADVTLIKKGSNTRVASGGALYLNPTGNAVLARGGSGDILAGLTAGLLAQFPSRPAAVACMGTFWHGRAADLLAAARGQTAVRTTDLLDFLPMALEYGPTWNLASRDGKPSGR